MLYRDVAAAHPPSLFLAAAFLLALEDSLEALRAAMGLLVLGTAGLVALAVWRLTQHRVAAATGGVASLLTPWALREHAMLIPESFGAPLLMGAALLAARDGRKSGAAGGLVAAIAASVKLALVIPALGLALSVITRTAYVAGFVLATAALTAGFSLAFGGALPENVLLAQAETGTAELRYVAGLWLQAGWNLLPLAALAAIAWRYRQAARDPALFRTLVALFLSTAALLLTLAKSGAYLNVVVVVEPPAVALGTAGVVWVWREARQKPSGAISRRLAGASLVAVALAGAQSASLLTSPSDPDVFVRPFSAPAHARRMSSEEVDRRVALARRCPADVPFSGPPFLAFLADRKMPANQPDQFIIANAETHRRFAEAARLAVPRCP